MLPAWGCYCKQAVKAAKSANPTAEDRYEVSDLTAEDCFDEEFEEDYERWRRGKEEERERKKQV